MPVHNAGPFLDEAIESILEQSFTEFEFVILDDASTDGSSDRLCEWARRDSRIRLLSAEHNLGPVESSNQVARAARAPIVARMDADDTSHRDRLAEQFAYLQAHRDVGVVASLCDVIDASDRMLRKAEVWRLARQSAFVPFAHGSMMWRRELFDLVGGYRKGCEYWEDQDLVTRMARVTAIAVLPKALYSFRQSFVGTRFSSDHKRLEDAIDLMYRSTSRVAEGLPYDDLLSGPPEAKVDPRVFISLGSILLWAGKRPRLFRRLLRRGRLSPDFTTFAAATWTAWASLSPSTLRAMLLFLLAFRNSLTKGKVGPDKPVAWTPAGYAPVEHDVNRRSREDFLVGEKTSVVTEERRSRPTPNADAGDFEGKSG